MERLFNSKGQHIANFQDDKIYLPQGNHIGYYLKDLEIFVDLHGKYIGEICDKNRLFFKMTSPYRTTNFGVRGSSGNIGNYGNPGNYGPFAIPAGYKDVILNS